MYIIHNMLETDISLRKQRMRLLSDRNLRISDRHRKLEVPKKIFSSMVSAGIQLHLQMKPKNGWQREMLKEQLLRQE